METITIIMVSIGVLAFDIAINVIIIIIFSFLLPL